MTRLLYACALGALMVTPAAAQDAPPPAPDAPETAETPAAPPEAAPEAAPEAPASPPAAAEAARPPPEATDAGSAAPEAPGPAAAASADAAEAPARRWADDRVHVALRWGLRSYLDPAYDAIGDDRSHLGVEIGLDVRLFDGLGVGLSFVGGGEQGALYRRDTAWQDSALFLSAIYRHRFPGLGLSAYGRLGPTVHWYHLQIGSRDDSFAAIDRAPWQLGARAAAGLEFWPVSPDFIRSVGDFGVGLVLEAYYDQAFIDDWSEGGVDPGAFDPSGPGWTLGITTRF